MRAATCAMLYLLVQYKICFIECYNVSNNTEWYVKIVKKYCVKIVWGLGYQISTFTYDIMYILVDINWYD